MKIESIFLVTECYLALLNLITKISIRLVRVIPSLRSIGFHRSSDYCTSSEPFFCVFSTDESILDIMMPDNATWDNHHHHSSIPDSIKDNLIDVYLHNVIKYFTSSVSIHEVNFEKNLSNM